MSKVTVTIGPDGRAKIFGEGFEATSLKKALEALGVVVERHEGHSHVHTTDEQETKQQA